MSAMNSQLVTPDLQTLRRAFQSAGFDIRLVGGCVRDLLAGLPAKDIDLCTDANPEEQEEVYRQADIFCVDTGLQHGTWTAVLNHAPYEITSLRVDRNTDGRHAEVVYIRDWDRDLERRDLTINAMSMDFDGNLHDPFGGQDDLKTGIVRFVGDANARLTEDYLRILRWYRFEARFGRTTPTQETEDALITHAPGLRGIARERVWSEMKRIIAHPRAYQTLEMMRRHGIFEHIDLPLHGERIEPCFAGLRAVTGNAVTMLALYLGLDGFNQIVQRWRLSNHDAGLGRFVLQHTDHATPIGMQRAKEMLTEKVSREYVFEALKVRGIYTPELEAWPVPAFPVQGQMLMPAFSRVALGQELQRLRQVWYENDFSDRAVLSEVPQVSPGD
jgi:tRNA nucleotidyltransferase/poly(A) polymerase